MNTLLHGQGEFAKTSIELSPTRIYPSPVFSGKSLFFSITDRKKDKIFRFAVDIENGKMENFSEDLERKNTLYEDGCYHLCSIDSGKTYTTAVYNVNDKKVYFETIDFNRRSSIKKGEIVLKKEDFLGATLSNNKILVMTQPKNKKILRFYFKEQDGTIISKDLEMPMIEFDESKTSLTNIISFASIVDAYTENDPSIISSPVKVYLEKDRIILSINFLNNYTQLLFWDLNTWQTTYKKISHNSLPDKKLPKFFPQSNSFYRNNTLLYGYVYPDKMSLNFLDLTSGKIIKRFDATEDDTISFKNTKITKAETAFNNGDGDLEIKKPSKLFRRIRDNYFLLSFNLLSNENIELTVGGDKSDQRGNSFIDKTIIMGGTMTNPAGYYTKGNYSNDFPGFRGNWGKVSFFKSILQKSTFNHIREATVSHISEKREQFIDSLYKNSDSKSIASFRTKADEYLAYYNPERKEIIVLKFDSKKD